MSSLLVRGENGGVSVTAESAGWRYVSFNALRIPNGGRFLLDTEGAGDLVPHARVAVLDVVLLAVARAPELV